MVLRNNVNGCDHVRMDCAVVLICTRGVERIAERLSLSEQTAILHTILEGHGMRDAVLVRPGHSCADAHLHIRGLVRIVLHGWVSIASDWSSLLRRILLVSSHHIAMVLLVTHHPIAIASRHKSTLCHRHSSHGAANSQQA